MPDRRNVLFIVIDQLRADCLTGRLAGHVGLPHLRALMADGATFRQHYSVANPCGPSRASMLTGRYAMNHRSVRNGTPLPHDTPNIATELRKAGRIPLLFGYTDTSMDPRAFLPADPRLTSYEEVMPGFDEAVEMRLERSLPWRAHLMERGYDVPPYPAIFRPAGPRPDAPALYRAADSDTAFLTDATLAGLRSRDAGWFAHVTYIRPHPPLVAPAPYNRMYDPSSLPMPDRAAAGEATRALHPFVAISHAKTPIASVVEGFPHLTGDDETVQMLRAIYLGLATEVDHHIGRLMTYLKEAGLSESTLIVLTADHGEMLGDHYSWGKSTFYDAAYHTPLIIRDPDRPASRGRVHDAPTESVDVAPTILDWLGLPLPETVDGRSLMPFLDGGCPGDWRDATFSELDYGNPIAPGLAEKSLGVGATTSNLAILRAATHTLVHFNGGLPPLLFERGDEMNNHAAKPEAAPILLKMTQAMLNHRMTHADGRFVRTMITDSGPVTATRD